MMRKICVRYAKSRLPSIGEYAFCLCGQLKNISIPDSVASIGSHAFYSSGAIQTERGVSYVDTWVIDCDTSATSVTIKEGIRAIGNAAFAGCNSLSTLVLPDSLTLICSGGYSGVFDGCNSLIYNEHENGKYLGNTNNPYMCLVDVIDSSVTAFTIPATTKFIGDEAFSGCTSLESLTIPDGMLSIGNSAFRSCSSLRNITIPDSVTSIGHSAFAWCGGLWTVTLPSGLTSISTNMFNHCWALGEITIPAGVTGIGVGAFEYCENLKSVVLPDSVTSIGNRVFSDCDELESLYIPASVTQMGEYQFVNCMKLTIYAEATEKPAGWDANWNHLDRPVEWGYTKE